MSTYTEHHRNYNHRHRDEITERTREYRKRYYQEHKEAIKRQKAFKKVSQEISPSSITPCKD